MYLYAYEELAWAIAQEREEEARWARAHAEHRRGGLPIRSRLARKLVHAGVHLDRAAGESALKAAVRGGC